MPILDLAGAKPIEGLKPQRGRRLDGQSRTMNPQNTAALIGLGGGSSGSFAAAKFNRLTLDFIAQSRSADQDLFGDNIRLRARARSLAINNPFARKFLAMVIQNVVGPAGILMQAKVRGLNGKDTAETKRINLRIEQEWKRWCKPGRCTADGKFSFTGLQQMAVKNVAREGENLLKLVYGRQFNDCGFALQPLDNDQLDDTYMTSLANDGSIRMGVEVDQYRRPLAYHLWKGHPYDIVANQRERQRVPAELVLHSAIWERPSQTRGYTWMAPVILALKMFAGWDEATLVAARASAAKFMVIEQAAADGWSPDDEDEQGNNTNSDGTQVMTANAGEAMVLDPGEKANFIDPRFPMNSHKEFSQTILRSIASGLLVSYPSLANDLEGVNFSSIRAGLLDERDSWRIIQRWFIEFFCEPVFQKWLKMALLTTLTDITLSPAQMEQIEWKARGWDWVDPLKDAQAIVLRLENGLITYADALAALGLDFEETMTERAMEQAFIEALGLVMGTDIRGQADTANDDSMADQQQSDQQGKGGKAESQKGGKADSQATGKKPGRVIQIEHARELLQRLRAARYAVNNDEDEEEEAS